MMFVAKSPMIARFIKSATHDARLESLLRKMDELEVNNLDKDDGFGDFGGSDNSLEETEEVEEEVEDTEDTDDDSEEIEETDNDDTDDTDDTDNDLNDDLEEYKTIDADEPDYSQEFIETVHDIPVIPDIAPEVITKPTEPEPTEPIIEPTDILQQTVSEHSDSIVCYSTERNLFTILPISKNLASNWATLVRMQETGMDRLFVHGKEVFIAGYGDYMLATEYNINTYIARLTIVADKSGDPVSRETIIKRIAKLRGMLDAL